MSDWLFDRLANILPKIDAHGVRQVASSWSMVEANITRVALDALRSAALNLELRDGVSDGTPPVGRVRFRAVKGRCQVNEGGHASDGSLRWRYIKGSEGERDIREYMTDADLVAGDATAGLQALFAEINRPNGGATLAKRCTVVVPRFTAENTLWAISSTCGYQGDVATSLRIVGETGTDGSGRQGSGFTWTGVQGGTMLKFEGINGSVFSHLVFDGGFNAKYLVRALPLMNGTTQLVPSSGLWVEHCTFQRPDYTDATSVEFLAGLIEGVEINNGSTYQASEYRFHRCNFIGANNDDHPGVTRQGWGFKTGQTGNTKNFVFTCITANYLYRAVECGSGYCLIFEANMGAMGYDGGPGACCLVLPTEVVILKGMGWENSQPGHACRVLSTGAGTTAVVSAVSLNGAPPANDVIMDLQGPTLLHGNNFLQNDRDATQLSWVASTAYRIGQQRKKSTNVYEVITAGTSASSGGPSGTGSDITDGTVHWKYVNTTNPNVLKVQTAGQYGFDVVGNIVGYRNNREYAFPLVDGSGNHIGGAIDARGDFARTSPNYVYLRGNNEGQVSGAKNLQLVDGTGRHVPCFLDASQVGNITSGIVISYNQDGRLILTVPYAAFITGSGKVVLGKLPPLAFLQSWGLTVATPLAGPSGTITCAIGVDYNGGSSANAIMVAKDVKGASAGDRYLLDADVGAGVATFMPKAQGGFFTDGANFYNALTATLTLGAGAVSDLNAGSLVFYFNWRRLPST